MFSFDERPTADLAEMRLFMLLNKTAQAVRIVTRTTTLATKVVLLNLAPIVAQAVTCQNETLTSFINEIIRH